MDSRAGTAFRPGHGPRVGQTASRSRLMTARDGELFAEISGGRTASRPGSAPAAAPVAGGTVVPGGVAVALLDGVVTEELPGPCTVFLRLDLQFLAPVRPGDVITGEVEVSSVRDDEPITGVHLRVTRDDGVVVVVGTALCRTAPAGPGS